MNLIKINKNPEKCMSSILKWEIRAIDKLIIQPEQLHSAIKNEYFMASELIIVCLA